MIISRYRTKVKRGRIQDAVAWIKKTFPDAVRICGTFGGDNDIVQYEFEFANIVEMAAALEGMLADPAKFASNVDSEWADITDGNSNELLTVLG